MKVLVYGLGLSGGGVSRVQYFLKKGHTVAVADLRTRKELGQLADYLEEIGVKLYLGSRVKPSLFESYDLVVKSQSIKNNDENLAHAKNITTDFAFLFSQKIIKKTKVICIVGRNSKAPTASVVCHVLNTLGKTARLCGNLGVSPLYELSRMEKGKIPEYLICELSGWQVRDAELYIQNDDFEVEITAFSEINSYVFVHSRSKKLICPANLKVKAESRLGKRKRIANADFFARSIPKTVSIGYSYAFGVLKFMGFSSFSIAVALTSFRGTPDKMEFVRTMGNGMFYNDSATMFPEYAEISYETFDTIPIHLICGGFDNSLDPSAMKKALSSCASLHLLGGTFTSDKLIPFLEENNIKYNGPFNKMEEVVKSAAKAVDNKSHLMQAVLFSPGCRCYGSYENIHERGEAFKDCVEKL